MIYNLVTWLRTKFPVLIFSVGEEVNTPDEVIVLSVSGGDVEHNHERTEYAVQLLCRSLDMMTAYHRINAVYEVLKNRFSFLLPKVAIGNFVFPAIQVAQASPVQAPGYIGTDDRGRHMYSVNFIFTV